MYNAKNAHFTTAHIAFFNCTFCFYNCTNCDQLHTKICPEATSVSVSTWMGDRQERPSAVTLGPFVGVDFKL